MSLTQHQWWVCSTMLIHRSQCLQSAYGVIAKPLWHYLYGSVTIWFCNTMNAAGNVGSNVYQLLMALLFNPWYIMSLV